MLNGSMFGSHHVPTRRWIPRIEISGDNIGTTPPEEMRVDPYLPNIGNDPFDPASVIVIPIGRFVGIGYARAVGGESTNQYRMAYTDTNGNAQWNRTSMTIQDGKYITPAGMSINQFYRQSGEFNTDHPGGVKYRKGFMGEVPFVLSVNNAHGNLVSGDRITGYSGSTTSTTAPNFIHRGKPVKWTSKKLYVGSVTSGSGVLSSAAYPGMTPRVVGGYNNGTLIASTPTVTWNGTGWAVAYTGAGTGVNTVVYEYGQDADMIGGEVIRIQSLSDILLRSDFLKWVEYAPFDYLNFPPAMQRVPVTQVSDEVPSTITAGTSYRVLHYPMSVHHPVTVKIQGVVVDVNGNSTTYSSDYTLPTSTAIDARGYFIGQYHSINWRTGVIELASNIVSVTSIKVSYSYVTDPREGAVLWGSGIIGLTDGSNVTVNSAPGYGIPAYLNIQDVVGALRMFIY